MYLRSLELLGFKSFARKTELRFPRGVAAVVGPNGCGKSNVLDAIRWVLGEQSAKALRGAEMADVIFNGTEALPALGLAEVSLTFADCERELGVAWNEVRLTRRVYRDGGSEYLLNKTVCRLRDIQELFMDTGIGRSAYSIMEQGKIDAILSSRPEDRRAIFEEAAGITKYKAQRREALRKLEATDANLQRLGDVLAEVRRQLGSLQRQAAKARRYQALHRDLTLLETHLGHAQWTALDADLRHARAEIERLRLVQADAEHALAGEEARLTELRASLAEKEAGLDAARTRAGDCRSRLESAQGRLEFNRERLRETEARLARLESEITANETSLREHQEHLRVADQEERSALSRLTGDQAQQAAEDARVRGLRERRQAAEAAVTAATRRAGEADGRLGSARAELSRAAAEEATAAARRELLEAELVALTPGLAEATERVAAARAELAAAERLVAERRAALPAAESADTAAMRALAAAESEVTAAGRRVAEKTSRLDALQSLVAEGEGLAAGAKAALRGAGRTDLGKAAVLGALGPMLEVVEPRFLPAVEAALGANLQAILVADADAAARILESLAEKKLGRAALVPPPSEGGEIRPRSDASAPSPGSDDLPRAVLGVVSAPATAEAVLARLLADTWIVGSLAAARQLQDSRPGCAAVTLGGEYLSHDGVWHGGRGSGDSAGQSLLQRRAQMRDLATEADAAREALAAAGARRDAAAQAAVQCSETLRSLRASVQDALAAAGGARAALGPLEREERVLAGRLEDFRREQTDFERKAQALRDRTSRVEKAIAEGDAALSRALADRAAAQESVEALRREEETISVGLNELRVRVAAEQQRHAGLAREKLPLAARCRELTAWITQARAELDDGRGRIASAHDAALSLTDAIEAAQTELEEAEAAVRELTASRARTATEAETLDAALRGRRHALSVLQSQRGTEEVREAELRMRQENLRERVEQKYHVDLREFTPQPEEYAVVLQARRRGAGEGSPQISQISAEGEGAAENADPGSDASGTPLRKSAESADDPSPDDIPALVARLAERLDGIGAVNLDAIVEYDALDERHRFLEAQDADLRKAEAELRGIIAKINVTSRQLFTETFERIRGHFGEMFREMFGGGRADLALADEEGGDPLECGIDITARPPGKPLQSISLLSGGERTMTAVALLFAIYMVKPSPFCVLDEMDAPLDESNIGRFIKVLDRFAGQSQFLVITHNKRTISRADALFGITMEEAGISKLVTVRLTRADGDTSSSAGEAIAVQEMGEGGTSANGGGGDVHVGNGNGNGNGNGATAAAAVAERE